MSRSSGRAGQVYEVGLLVEGAAGLIELERALAICPDQSPVAGAELFVKPADSLVALAAKKARSAFAFP